MGTRGCGDGQKYGSDGDRGAQNPQKMTKKRPPKKWFWGRQVGAFSVFRPGDTGTPFIFWGFLPFFHKIDRFRG